MKLIHLNQCQTLMSYVDLKVWL